MLHQCVQLDSCLVYLQNKLNKKELLEKIMGFIIRQTSRKLLQAPEKSVR